MSTYEKKLVSNSAEIQELHKQVKQTKLENEHLKGMGLKFKQELEDRDRILDVSLSPMKKPKALDLLTDDFIENDIYTVFFIKTQFLKHFSSRSLKTRSLTRKPKKTLRNSLVSWKKPSGKKMS